MQPENETPTGPESEPARGQPPPEGGRADLSLELGRLVDLTARYPEIGPAVAELALKAGYREVGERVLRLGLEGEAPGLEYHFIAFRTAKQARNYHEALGHCLGAARAFAAAPDRYPTADDGSKLLHLVRQGFQTLLFDLKDPQAHPAFTSGMAEELPKLAERLDADPFFHTLLAQALWHRDREASEREWERAAELGEPEFTFNARGTWYKEAEGDVHKSERAYRQGMERVPGSPLLRHNLAQLLLEKAQRLKDEQPETARRALIEADGLIKGALQGDCPRGLRRHIHATRAEVMALRSALRPPRREAPEVQAPAGEAQEVAPEPERTPPPEVGQVLRGRVRSLTAFGAFVALGGGWSGLLHKSEMAHEAVADPAQVVQPGQELEVKVIEVLPPREGKDGGRPRIGLSRRALVPVPEGVAPAPERGRRERRPQEEQRRPPEGRQGRQREGEKARGEGARLDERPRGEGRSPEGHQGRRDDRRDDRRDRPARRLDEGRGPRRSDDPRSSRPSADKIASLGEMLLAKLKEQQEGK